VLAACEEDLDNYKALEGDIRSINTTNESGWDAGYNIWPMVTKALILLLEDPIPEVKD
jgi:hypothetical protein